jgi:integrase
MARRRRGTPPPYLPHSSGQAYSTLNGVKHYHGLYGTPESRAAYAAFLREWEAAQDGQLSPVAARGRPTVGQVCELFMVEARKKHRRADGSPTTEVRAYTNAFKPLLAAHRHMDADDLRAQHLIKIRDDWRAKGLFLTTVNRDLARIVRCWKWALSYEHITRVSAGTVTSLQAVAPLAPGEAPEGEPIETVEEWIVLATLPHISRQLAAVVRLQMACGMRPGEACAMRGAEIDFDGKASYGGRVMQEPGVWTFVPRQHKSRKRKGKSKYLVYLLGPQAQEVLKPWLRADPEEYLFQPREARAEWDADRRRRRQTPVQPSQACRAKSHAKRRPGACYNSSSYAHAIKAGVAKANRARAKKKLPPLPHWSPNQLRHNWITRVDAIEGIGPTSKAIGHTSVNTTLVYIQQRIELAAAIARKHG